MLIFVTFSLLLLPLTSFAQNIDVEYGFNKYSLKMSSSEIKFQKKNHIIVVKKEECSANLFNDFTDRFAKLAKVKQPDQKKVKLDDFQVKYKVDKNAGNLNTTHPYAKTLLSIPQQFDIFKLATEFRCEDKK